MKPRDTQGEVTVDAGGTQLAGTLSVPDRAMALVMFVHGSGSSRFSPRNNFVARHLNDAGVATLLFDLLTEEEELAEARTAHLRFNIDLLSDRVATVTDWLVSQPEVQRLKLGYFGASTGAAAALVAAAERPDRVGTVVSRGGRPDLAGEALRRVRCPVLLLVGGYDVPVIELNRAAAAQISSPKELRIIPNASHLFEEPGKLAEVAAAARRWFVQHLA